MNRRRAFGKTPIRQGRPQIIRAFPTGQEAAAPSWLKQLVPLARVREFRRVRTWPSRPQVFAPPPAAPPDENHFARVLLSASPRMFRRARVGHRQTTQLQMFAPPPPAPSAADNPYPRWQTVVLRP